MTELLAAGGCYNAMRMALDGSAADTRDWRGAINTNQVFTDVEKLILAVSFDGDDMNIATDATFKIQWRNVSDAGSFADLAATGEIKWGSAHVTMVNNHQIAAAAFADAPSSIDCTGKGWTVLDIGSKEIEGANGITQTVDDDELFDLHWSIDLDSADSLNGDQYEFRVTESGGTVIGTAIGKLTVVEPGKLVGITKDAKRQNVVVSVTVSVFNSDGGSPAKPTGTMVAQQVSNGTTGAYDIQSTIIKNAEYFLLFTTTTQSDGSIEQTAAGL